MTTINDIARMAKVSTSTVSHVVNKTRYVSPELVERVERAIQELDYPPNFVVKKSSKNVPIESGKVILLLLTDKGSNFQRQVERHVEAQLRDKNYILITLCLSQDVVGMKEFLNDVIEQHIVAGILVFPDEQELLTEQVLNAYKIPVVVLGRKVKNFLADNIYTDNTDGAYKATRHLIKKGHEQIGFLGSNQKRSAMRLEGFRQALAEFQLPVREEYIYPALTDDEEIFCALDVLLTGRQMPTALFVANYAAMIPLLRYMESHNINCPADLSIVSFNNFEWAALHTPAITTIEQNVEEMGRLAVQILLQRIQNQEYANQATFKDTYQECKLSTKIMVRSSTSGIGRGPFGEKAASAGELLLSEEEIEQLRQMKLTAAISFHYAGKAWMELHQKGIKKVFDEIGISIIAVTDAHFDAGLQCRQLESLRILEPDIIIAIPADNQKTSSAFKKVADSNTKLILITNVPEGLTPDDYVTCVSVNERSHGQNMGHGLGDYMVKHGLVNYGLITHAANFYATNQRDNAARQVLAEEYPELHLCQEVSFSKEDEVYQETCDYINRYPETEAFYVSWDGPAMEVISALTEMGRSDIAIVTSDLDYQDAMNMAKGGMIKMLGAQCTYEQGEAIAWAAANAILNRKVPSFIGIEPISVTADNLLKSWKQIFKADPGAELIEAFKSNPNYVSVKE